MPCPAQTSCPDLSPLMYTALKISHSTLLSVRSTELFKAMKKPSKTYQQEEPSPETKLVTEVDVAPVPDGWTSKRRLEERTQERTT
uniref:Uncharacterized protein n=1 Tax=Megaselia scalaris TaxID=36166 RepID=T1GQZ4_MEGSC